MMRSVKFEQTEEKISGLLKRFGSDGLYKKTTVMINQSKFVVGSGLFSKKFAICDLRRLYTIGSNVFVVEANDKKKNAVMFLQFKATDTFYRDIWISRIMNLMETSMRKGELTHAKFSKVTVKRLPIAADAGMNLSSKHSSRSFGNRGDSYSRSRFSVFTPRRKRTMSSGDSLGPTLAHNAYYDWEREGKTCSVCLFHDWIWIDTVQEATSVPTKQRRLIPLSALQHVECTNLAQLRDDPDRDTATKDTENDDHIKAMKFPFEIVCGSAMNFRRYRLLFDSSIEAKTWLRLLSPFVPRRLGFGAFGSSMSTEPTQDCLPFVLSGWVEKRAERRIKTWRRRWLVLDRVQRTLSWYQSPDDGGASCVLWLAPETVVVDGHEHSAFTQKAFGFWVHGCSKSSRRNRGSGLFFNCSSLYEKDVWVAAIQRVAAGEVCTRARHFRFRGNMKRMMRSPHVGQMFLEQGFVSVELSQSTEIYLWQKKKIKDTNHSTHRGKPSTLDLLHKDVPSPIACLWASPETPLDAVHTFAPDSTTASEWVETLRKSLMPVEDGSLSDLLLAEIAPPASETELLKNLSINSSNDDGAGPVMISDGLNSLGDVLGGGGVMTKTHGNHSRNVSRSQMRFLKKLVGRPVSMEAKPPPPSSSLRSHDDDTETSSSKKKDPIEDVWRTAGDLFATRPFSSGKDRRFEDIKSQLVATYGADWLDETNLFSLRKAAVSRGNVLPNVSKDVSKRQNRTRYSLRSRTLLKLTSTMAAHADTPESALGMWARGQLEKIESSRSEPFSIYEILRLLGSDCRNSGTRMFAAERIADPVYFSDETVIQFLPQLVQAMKFEYAPLSDAKEPASSLTFEKARSVPFLTKSLMRRAVQNLEFATQLTWLLVVEAAMPPEEIVGLKVQLESVISEADSKWDAGDKSGCIKCYADFASAHADDDPRFAITLKEISEEKDVEKKGFTMRSLFRAIRKQPYDPLKGAWWWKGWNRKHDKRGSIVKEEKEKAAISDVVASSAAENIDGAVEEKSDGFDSPTKPPPNRPLSVGVQPLLIMDAASKRLWEIKLGIARSQMNNWRMFRDCLLAWLKCLESNKELDVAIKSQRALVVKMNDLNVRVCEAPGNDTASKKAALTKLLTTSEKSWHGCLQSTLLYPNLAMKTVNPNRCNVFKSKVRPIYISFEVDNEKSGSHGNKKPRADCAAVRAATRRRIMREAQESPPMWITEFLEHDLKCRTEKGTETSSRSFRLATRWKRMVSAVLTAAAHDCRWGPYERRSVGRAHDLSEEQVEQLFRYICGETIIKAESEANGLVLPGPPSESDTKDDDGKEDDESSKSSTEASKESSKSFDDDAICTSTPPKTLPPPLPKHMKPPKTQIRRISSSIANERGGYSTQRVTLRIEELKGLNPERFVEIRRISRKLGISVERLWEQKVTLHFCATCKDKEKSERPQKFASIVAKNKSNKEDVGLFEFEFSSSEEEPDPSIYACLTLFANVATDKTTFPIMIPLGTVKIPLRRMWNSGPKSLKLPLIHSPQWLRAQVQKSLSDAIDEDSLEDAWREFSTSLVAMPLPASRARMRLRARMPNLHSIEDMISANSCVTPELDRAAALLLEKEKFESAGADDIVDSPVKPSDGETTKSVCALNGVFMISEGRGKSRKSGSVLNIKGGDDSEWKKPCRDSLRKTIRAAISKSTTASPNESPFIRSQEEEDVERLLAWAMQVVQAHANGAVADELEDLFRASDIDAESEIPENVHSLVSVNIVKKPKGFDVDMRDCPWMQYAIEVEIKEDDDGGHLLIRSSALLSIERKPKEVVMKSAMPDWIDGLSTADNVDDDDSEASKSAADDGAGGLRRQRTATLCPGFGPRFVDAQLEEIMPLFQNRRGSIDVSVVGGEEQKKSEDDSRSLMREVHSLTSQSSLGNIVDAASGEHTNGMRTLTANLLDNRVVVARWKRGPLNTHKWNTMSTRTPLGSLNSCSVQTAVEITAKHFTWEPTSRSENPLNLAKDMEEFSVIFKKGDDLRQDMLVLQLVGLMDMWCKAEGLDLMLTKYEVLATRRDAGLIEVVPGTMTMSKIKERHGTIAKFLSDRGGHFGTTLESEALEMCTRSLAGYAVITYILGIGDRHFDNILVQDTGRFVHIDFGWAFGYDPKDFTGLKSEIRFNKDMLAILGGTETEAFRYFMQWCCDAYIIIRKHASEIEEVLALMCHSGLEHLELNSLATIRKNLCLWMKPDSARVHMTQVLDRCRKSVGQDVLEMGHRVAIAVKN